MSELLLKIGDGSNFRDGDILHAITDRRIKQVHAEHLSHPRNMPRVRGRMVPNCLAEDYQKETYQYKFQRISETEIVRTTLATGEQHTFSNVPTEVDGKMQSIDVPLYIARRLKNPNNLIYGEVGSEYWYGGKVDFSETKINKVWDNLEAKTPQRRAGLKFPWGTKDKKSHLVVPVASLTEEQAREYESSEYGEEDAEGNRELLKKRKHFVDIADVVREARVRDSDIRDREKAVEITEVVNVVIRQRT